MNARINAAVLTTYVEVLISGDRNATRRAVDAALTNGHKAFDLLTALVWPAMEMLQQLHRDDRISIASLNLGTRLNRMVAEQLTASLDRAASIDKKVLIFCGDDEPEELGGQICADLFDAAAGRSASRVAACRRTRSSRSSAPNARTC
jgi:methanogenic corrinoid protein MtbC1